MSDPAAPPRLIGRRLPLVDARAKVTGEGVYADDVRLPHMLVGKLLRSTRAHARLVRVDVGAARALPGVAAVVTGAAASKPFGVLPISKDETALAREKVIYFGDIVAAVAAESEELARRARAAIAVEYEDLPRYLKPADSLKPAAEKIHPHQRDRDAPDTNVHKTVAQTFGDPDADFAAAAHCARARFEMAGLNHAFTEPHAVVAHFDTEGLLTVWTCQQVPHYLHRALSEVLELPMHRIRVIRTMVGGAFGGKSDPFPHEMCAALLSRECRRPVKILFDREEVFLTNHGRHPTELEVAAACDADGCLTALDVDALIDGGAWGSFGVVSTYYNGVLSQGPYRFRSFRYRGRRVYTNKPPSGAMRGHGAVNTRFAMETLIDELAVAAGLDPFTLRRRNLLGPNTKTLNEFRITSYGFPECLDRVEEASRFHEKWGRLPRGRGIGLGCGFYISGSALRIHWNKLPQSTCHLKADMDGAVTIHCAAAEIGQGSNTVLAQIVGEVLGLPLARLRVSSADSQVAPFDLGSYSSRVTFQAGLAAQRAAERMADELRRAAQRLTGAPAEDLVLADERVISPRAPGVGVSFDEALHEAMADAGALTTRGHYGDAPPMGGTFKGAAAGLSPSYSYQAFTAEVEVDEETGVITVLQVHAAHDCGRALNPLAVEGQIEGSVHMGIGQALMEELRYHQGMLLNANLLDYRIPTPTQTPPITVHVVESQDPEGPFGAKECGEGALAPIIPAIANAVYDAVGLRLRTLPMTPDVVLAALERQARRPRGRGRLRASGFGLRTRHARLRP